MKSKEETMMSFELFKKKLNESHKKLNKEGFENRQLKELIVSMALEIKMLRDTIEHLNKDKEIKKDLEKLEKAIEILKGRVCVNNGYVCYDTYADIKLNDEEIDLLYEVLSHEEI